MSSPPVTAVAGNSDACTTGSHFHNGKKEEKLLWDSPEFAKLYRLADKFTGIYARQLLEMTDIQAWDFTSSASGTDKEVKQSNPLVVLDNACGTGVITGHLHDLIQPRYSSSLGGVSEKDVFVTCGDFADVMVDFMQKRVIRENWQTNTRVLKVNAMDTNLPSDHFTHVYTNFGPFLMPDPSKMLWECHRILKSPSEPKASSPSRSGGVCAFTTWQRSGWHSDIAAAFATMPSIPQLPDHNTTISMFGKGEWWDEGYVRDQLERHQFIDVQTKAVPLRTEISMADFQATMDGTLSMVTSKLWTEEQKKTNDLARVKERVVEYMKKKVGDDGIVVWDWVAILAMGRKC